MQDYRGGVTQRYFSSSRLQVLGEDRVVLQMRGWLPGWRVRPALPVDKEAAALALALPIDDPLDEVGVLFV